MLLYEAGYFTMYYNVFVSGDCSQNLQPILVVTQTGNFVDYGVSKDTPESVSNMIIFFEKAITVLLIFLSSSHCG